MKPILSIVVIALAITGTFPLGDHGFWNKYYTKQQEQTNEVDDNFHMSASAFDSSNKVVDENSYSIRRRAF